MPSRPAEGVIERWFIVPCSCKGQIGRRKPPTQPISATGACRAQSGRGIESEASGCTLATPPLWLMSAIGTCMESCGASGWVHGVADVRYMKDGRNSSAVGQDRLPCRPTSATLGRDRRQQWAWLTGDSVHGLSAKAGPTRRLLATAPAACLTCYADLTCCLPAMPYFDQTETSGKPSTV